MTSFFFFSLKDLQEYFFGILWRAPARTNFRIHQWFRLVFFLGFLQVLKLLGIPLDIIWKYLWASSRNCSTMSSIENFLNGIPATFLAGNPLESSSDIPQKNIWKFLWEFLLISFYHFSRYTGNLWVLFEDSLGVPVEFLQNLFPGFLQESFVDFKKKNPSEIPPGISARNSFGDFFKLQQHNW